MSTRFHAPSLPRPSLLGRPLLASLPPLLVLGLLVTAGPATSAEREEAIGLRIARESFNLQLTPDAVSGPGFQVFRSPRELRGRASLGTLTLELKDDGVKGVINGAAVQLEVWREGEVLHAKGGFGGSPVELRLSPQELHVYVRDCTYRLKATQGGKYVGPRSCDSSLTPPAEVALPPSFLSSSASEQAALLLLALPGQQPTTGTSLPTMERRRR